MTHVVRKVEGASKKVLAQFVKIAPATAYEALGFSSLPSGEYV